MINFQKYLYKGVGSRIKGIRKSMGFKQVDFVSKIQEKYISIDRFKLSHIENGKAYTEKNPYLLTEDQMLGISELTGYTSGNLIFGNDKEKEDSVKLILLAIIMNGTKYANENRREEFMIPFIDTRVTKKDCEEVYKELKKGHSKEIAGKKSEELVWEKLKEFLKLSRGFIKNESADRIFDLCLYVDPTEEINDEEIEGYIEWFKINQSFFANTNHFESMEYLTNESDEELENPSNLLIKLLMGNNSFAQLFMKGLSNRTHNQRTIPASFPEGKQIIVDDFIRNSGQFGDLAIGFKDSGFNRFAIAFTEMWERNNREFMDYFNKFLFNIDLSEHGLKKIDDEFIHSLITSNEFSKMLYDMVEVERYGMETMKGHNTFELHLQEMVIKNNAIDLVSLSKTESFKYIYSMIQTNNAHL